MTPVEAQAIIKVGLSLDMPFLMGKSLELALFKVGGAPITGEGYSQPSVLQTYGIPTISDLLRHTTEFKDPAKAGRRRVLASPPQRRSQRRELILCKHPDTLTLQSSSLLSSSTRSLDLVVAHPR